MLIEAVYARFFRSLNYDYLRKSDPRYTPDPWDRTPSGADYPFIRVRLDSEITTVVGANESGKSQLLDAVKMALSGEKIERGDFCRYSPFFSNDAALTLPEFGLRFQITTTAQRETVAEMCELEESPKAGAATFFRMNETPKLRIYLLRGGSWEMAPVRKPSLLRVLGLPAYFEIDADTPLPDSVPLDFLVAGKLDPQDKDGLGQRLRRLAAKGEGWFSSAEALRGSADEVIEALREGVDIDPRAARQYRLADDLLTKVAGLERELFVELRKAVEEERNGYANSIVDKVNEELSKSLNFPHWWSQDSAFRLMVDLRETGLAFVIHDRTGTSYSFDERSAGLKYFLSYFVQHLSHEPPADGQPEILLMDEPDAFLSSSGQQDLMRIFTAFASAERDSTPPVQVVYVTHSPFLIDKNHAERIRVLEKGEHDEGTRVVANVSRNHYEPLRSALGGFLGETAFIGTCNLLLEGASDQILLAGISSLLAREDASLTQRLDLNSITLVPAGSASQVPYVAFLARGRDIDRPPVIVLLDGDHEGDLARETLKRGGPRRRELVRSEHVLQLGDPELADIDADNPAGAVEIEDLIPLELCVAAVIAYCQEFAPEHDLGDFGADPTLIFAEGRATPRGLEQAVRDHLGKEDFHVDKVGFARSVLAVVEGTDAEDAAVVRLKANFSVLLAELAKRERSADREAGQERIRSRVNRIRRRFLADHSGDANCEDVLLLVEEIDSHLDGSHEAEDVRAEMRAWGRDFELEENPRAPLPRYEEFLARLEGLPYAGARSVQVSD